VKREAKRLAGSDLSAIILAGGTSSRMGRDKAWIEFEGKPLIRLAVDKLRHQGLSELFISGRVGVDYSALECPVIFDLEPGLGPMGGIERGLHECASPLLLVLAVDLPHLTTGLLEELAAHCDHWTGIVPKVNGELEPLVAIYPKRCHAFAAQALAGMRRAARAFAGACLRERAVRAYTVSPASAHCFTNWNTPADAMFSRAT
jgi:molybdenum cofactor guanylyltransferase